MFRDKKHRVTLLALFILFVVFGARLAKASLPVYGPFSITLTASGTSEIDLSWNAVIADPPVSGYRIDRESPSGAGFTTIAANTGSAATTYADQGLSPNTNYGYRIFALNASGTGPVSPNVAALNTGAPPLGTLPLAPQNLTAAAASASEIDLNWTQPQNYSPVTGYRIERNSTIIVPNTGSAGTSYADTGLSPGVTYDYRLTAINSFGLSPFSLVVSAMTFTTPMAPQSASAAAGDGQAVISWNKPLFTGGGIRSYLISVIPGTSTLSVLSSTTNAVITGLKNGVSYSFGVSAVNPAGQSQAIITNTVVPAASVAQATSVSVQIGATSAAVLASSTASLPAGFGASLSAPAKFIFTYMLQIGSRGGAVAELQKRLASEGFLNISPTGYFGTLTRAAVMAYQRAHGLSPVGILGPLTRASLNAK